MIFSRERCSMFARTSIFGLCISLLMGGSGYTSRPFSENPENVQTEPWVETLENLKEERDVQWSIYSKLFRLADALQFNYTEEHFAVCSFLRTCGEDVEGIKRQINHLREQIKTYKADSEDFLFNISDRAIKGDLAYDDDPTDRLEGRFHMARGAVQCLNFSDERARIFLPEEKIKKSYEDYMKFLCDRIAEYRREIMDYIAAL